MEGSAPWGIGRDLTARSALPVAHWHQVPSLNYALPNSCFDSIRDSPIAWCPLAQIAEAPWADPCAQPCFMGWATACQMPIWASAQWVIRGTRRNRGPDAGQLEARAPYPKRGSRETRRDVLLGAKG